MDELSIPEFGKTLAPSLRIYLTGRTFIEAGETLFDERAFPGRQGRLLFAALILERARPVTREEFAEMLWPKELPVTWDGALSALISHLRSILTEAGLPRDAIQMVTGCYHLRLPESAWVNVDAATRALDEAEGALNAGDSNRAYNFAGVVTAVTRRPFLPGETGPWAEGQRERLHGIRYRGLDCFATIFKQTGEIVHAIVALEEMISLEPFRESAYRRMMQIHLDAGTRAEALRVYEDCRLLISSELGVNPAPQTQAIYLEALRQT